MVQGNDADARSSVDEVIRRYFIALDGRDRSMMLTVFADDARIDYDGRFHASGLPAIREFFESGVASAGIGIAIRSTIHVIADVHIDTDSNGATSRTHAVAYLSGTRGDRDVVLMRGLRYVDRLEPRAPGWQIVQRAHQPLWAVEHLALPTSVVEHRAEPNPEGHL